MSADTSHSPAPREAAERPARRFVARARSLDALVGAHPAALRDLYRDGRPADPEQLGAKPRGRLLAMEGLQAVHLLVRPLVVTVARHLLPWRGKSFEASGRGGRNRVLDWQLLPFHCQTGPSELDGRPTLFLRYDGVGNPWPLSRVVDELRFVGEGVAIGPGSVRTVRGPVTLIWWGLEQP